MRKKIPPLPTLLTAGNLICGFLSLIFALNDSLKLAGYKDVINPFVISSWFILIAMVFDLFDGVAARLMNNTSQFGIEFDSLADLVSFGVSPAVLMYLSILRYMPLNLGWVFATFYVGACAFRLARFNTEAIMGRQDMKNFNGLPSPAAASVLVSYVVFSRWAEWYYVEKPRTFLDTAMGWYAENISLVHKFAIPALMLLVAFFMVSNIKFPSFKHYLAKRKVPMLFVPVAFALMTALILATEVTVFAITLFYVFLGVITHFFYNIKEKTKKAVLKGRENV
jgi:CDP-diacylglycerol--serine O-phosphatidyltransferase